MLEDIDLADDVVPVLNWSLYPSLEFEVGFEKESVFLDRIEFSPKNKESLKNLTFQKLASPVLKKIKVKDIKKYVEDALKNEDFSKAYELNKILGEYNAVEEISEYIINYLFQISLEPVTFGIPRVLSYMFGAYKERIRSKFNTEDI